MKTKAAAIILFAVQTAAAAATTRIKARTSAGTAVTAAAQRANEQCLYNVFYDFRDKWIGGGAIGRHCFICLHSQRHCKRASWHLHVLFFLHHSFKIALSVLRVASCR